MLKDVIVSSIEASEIHKTKEEQPQILCNTRQEEKECSQKMQNYVELYIALRKSHCGENGNSNIYSHL